MTGQYGWEWKQQFRVNWLPMSNSRYDCVELRSSNAIKRYKRIRLIQRSSSMQNYEVKKIILYTYNVYRFFATA